MATSARSQSRSAENVRLEAGPDPKLEKEAEETAQRVLFGGEVGIQRLHETDVF